MLGGIFRPSKPVFNWMIPYRLDTLQLTQEKEKSSVAHCSTGWFKKHFLECSNSREMLVRLSINRSCAEPCNFWIFRGLEVDFETVHRIRRPFSHWVRMGLSNSDDSFKSGYHMIFQNMSLLDWTPCKQCWKFLSPGCPRLPGFRVGQLTPTGR